MAGQLDTILGKVKETVGGVTGNKSLKTEGMMQQVVGYAKQAFEVVVGWGGEVAKEIKNSRGDKA
jgi:uncharacterized protein YjbJ (UPF0337 family)